MKRAILSCSGGLDSTSLLIHLLAKNYKVTIANFNYGSDQNTVEHQRLSQNLEYLKSKGFDIDLVEMDLSAIMSKFYSSLTRKDIETPEGHYADENMKLTVVPNRNAIFASIIYGLALSQAKETGDNVDICLGIHGGDHCFTKDTNILTPDGLKTIDTLKEGDKIFSFNFKLNEWDLDTVTKLVNVGYSEYINKITTNAGELKLTDEHKVFKLKLSNFNPHYGYDKTIEEVKVKDLQEGDYLIQPTNLYSLDVTDISKIDLKPIAEEILEKCEPPVELHEEENKLWIGNRKELNELSINRFVDTKSFVEILAWYIAEGFSSKNGFIGSNSKGGKFRAEFCQSLKSNLEKVELIKDSLAKLGYPVKFEFSKKIYNGIPKEVTWYCSNILSIFMKDCGSHSYVKHIPDWLFNMLLNNLELRETFLYTIGLADGFNTESMYRGFCSSSPKLLEQMITLIQLSGYHFSYGKNQAKKTKYITYAKKGQKQALITLGDAKFTQIRKIEKEEYKDDVFDITVENNHNFCAGNYGQHLISNCIYPDCRPEFIDAIYKAFALGNWDSEKVNVYVPYLNGNKKVILEDALSNCEKLGIDFNIVLSNTLTCYKPNEKGESCGKCGSCTERLEAFNMLGLKDPVKYME